MVNLQVYCILYVIVQYTYVRLYCCRRTLNIYKHHGRPYRWKIASRPFGFMLSPFKFTSCRLSERNPTVNCQQLSVEKQERRGDQMSAAEAAPSAIPGDLGQNLSQPLIFFGPVHLRLMTCNAADFFVVLMTSLILRYIFVAIYSVCIFP